MLNLESSSFSRAREARVDERRSSRRDARASCRLTLRTIGADLEDRRLETGGTADGTTGTAMLGGGGAGILAALPMPLGSLTELLRPPALPGPRHPAPGLGQAPPGSPPTPTRKTTIC